MSESFLGDMRRKHRREYRGEHANDKDAGSLWSASAWSAAGQVLRVRNAGVIVCGYSRLAAD